MVREVREKEFYCLYFRVKEREAREKRDSEQVLTCEHNVSGDWREN